MAGEQCDASVVQFNSVHISRASHKQYEAIFPIQTSVAIPISIVNCVSLVVDGENSIRKCSDGTDHRQAALLEDEWNEKT